MLMSRLRYFFTERRAADDALQLLSGDVTPRGEKRIRQRQRCSGKYTECLNDNLRILAEMQGLREDARLLPALRSDDDTRLVIAVQRWQAVAALLVVAVLAGAWLYESEVTDPTDIKRYVTRTGEQKTVNLADGSIVNLNTSTQILVDITDDYRRIILEQGEAYFDVASETNRLFTVELGQQAVSVFGTEFNIYRTPEKFTLAVAEGRVNVYELKDKPLASLPALQPDPQGKHILDGDGQYSLSAGLVAEFDVDDREYSVYKADDIAAFQNWRQNVIHFNAAPLSQVVAELNRYSAKKILIEDSEIMNLNLYATVHLDRIDEALNLIEGALPIKVSRRVDRIVIYAE